jgi:5'-3' exonuclease
MQIALIDGDILVYRIGFASEDEPESIAIARCCEFIEDIILFNGFDEYQGYLTGKGNFRNEIAVTEPYKGNRKAPKPKHYQALRDYMQNHWQFEMIEGQEADDAIGIAAYTLDPEEYCICSIDKDLLMIPGRHYNFVHRKHSEITELEGRHNFYMQLLTGDPTDNIPGIYKVGPVKATSMLAGCQEIHEYNEAVLKAYKDYFSHCTEEDVIKHITLIGQLLWIRREEGEEWKFELD